MDDFEEFERLLRSAKIEEQILQKPNKNIISIPKNPLSDPAESVRPNLTELSRKDLDSEVNLDEIELPSEPSESSSLDDDCFDAAGGEDD